MLRPRSHSSRSRKLKTFSGPAAHELAPCVSLESQLKDSWSPFEQGNELPALNPLEILSPATSIALMVGSLPVAILALSLAALVAQSRVEGRIHTLREVIVGALLAMALCVIVFRLPLLIARILP